MKLVLMGAPGAGKGTHARFLSEKYHIPHISTGDIFRANMREKTPLGLEARRYIEQGLLVPDELTLALIWDRLQQEDCEKGYILDGFPRDLEQAEAFSRWLSSRNEELDYVIHLVVDEEAIIRRMGGRRVCPVCGASYNVDSMPPAKEGICDVCGSAVVQREDDREETVLKRLAVYRQQTEPIAAYYRELGKEVCIDSSRSIEEVHADMRALWGEEDGSQH